MKLPASGITMKSKPAAPESQGKLPKIPKSKAGKSVKALPKKSQVNRVPIKLRASTEKHVPKRAQDRPSKLSVTSVSHQGISGPLDKNRSSNNKTLVSEKSRSFTKIKSADKFNRVNKKAMLRKSGVMKAKTNKNGKGSLKRQVVKQLNASDFFDVWAFVSIGKREASLNASMKVNIMFERHTASKSTKTQAKKTELASHSSKQDDYLKDKISGKSKATVESCSAKSNKKMQSDSVKKLNCSKDKEGGMAKEKAHQGHKKLQEKTGGKKALKSTPFVAGSGRQKSLGHKVTEKEPLGKRCHSGKKIPTKLKSKVAKRVKKSLPSGHQLCNIIEKSPRQASLVAKAMIAMEQEEEEAVVDSAARTQIYDWTELRSYTRTKSRRIQWFNGLGNFVKEKAVKDNHENQHLANENEAGANDAEVSSGCDPNKALEGESLHNTLLRTLHQTGDGRLLNEYLRAQKEDFQGFVDVETCATPEEQKLPSPDPKKSLPTLAEHEEPEKVVEKPANCSPAKPQSCRVATPIPQFPAGHRTSNIANFIHNPISQSVYPQQRGYAQPQPIKVTPYPPSPAYIYQYSANRTQTEVYAPPSPSPLPYGISNNDVASRDYATFTFNQIGRLNLDGRAMNPYQSAAFSTNLHLPVQQIGELLVCSKLIMQK